MNHHLLLPLTATRRDLADPAVINDVASEVGSIELLQVLYVLTIADSRATGPSMWNDWKASLLKTLFLRCAARLGAYEPAITTGAATRQEVLARSGGSIDEMAAHLDAMPDDYLRALSVEEVLWHLELVSDLKGVSNLGVRVGEPIDTVVVVGPSQPGFRRTVAAVFAANGVDVLEARLFGRSDGVVVDSFQVRDDRTGGMVRGSGGTGFASMSKPVFSGSSTPMTGSPSAPPPIPYPRRHVPGRSHASLPILPRAIWWSWSSAQTASGDWLRSSRYSTAVVSRSVSPSSTAARVR